MKKICAVMLSAILTIGLFTVPVNFNYITCSSAGFADKGFYDEISEQNHHHISSQVTVCEEMPDGCPNIQ